MVKLTSHAGPLRTIPARRLLCRLAVFVGIPAAYLVVAALGRSVGLGGALRASASVLPLDPTWDSGFAPREGPGPASTRRLLWAEGENCTPPAILDFPRDLFSLQQRRHGAVILHGLLACYLFALFAVVCDEYFIPSIKKLCRSLQMSDDVAGATLMAAASSSPELFINLVGTFVTEGDIGVGAVVGSAVFNILAVPACCGLFASTVVALDWWPVTRDSIAYGITVIALIFTLRDGRVEWYEALLLVNLYLGYLTAMCFNSSIRKAVKSLCKPRQGSKEPGENSPLLRSGSDVVDQESLEEKASKVSFADDEDEISDLSLSSWPKDCGRWERAWWVIVWPISVLLYLTIPDCRQERWKRLSMLTFMICIVWIALTSYMVAWMITVIGDTLQIPDSVMGLTFLAAGMSVPEAVSSVIVTKQGHGAMGISNSLGSNVFDILLCLGLPWLIKAAFFPLNPSDHGVIINSRGLAYSAITLLSTLLALYGTFLVNRFQLNWKMGLTCLTLYAAYLVVASLIELNVFFVVNLPTCAIDI